SSRTYGGYNTIHPEPESYETGFAVKAVIQLQIDGDPALNWDPGLGQVLAPLLLWGPYLWADGERPRRDGLTWCPADFEPNNNPHPSPLGEEKVSDLLHAFFMENTTTQAWFPNTGLAPLVALDATDDSWVLDSQPNANFGSETTLRIEGQA